MPGFHINRGAHIDIKTCMDSLADFCRDEGISEEYISMIEFLGADAFAAAVPKEPIQFATPRTVVGKAYPYLCAMLGDDVSQWDVDSVRRGLAPLVGAEYAKGMVDYFAYGKDIPTMDQIDRDPEGTPVPTNKAALMRNDA